MTREQVLTILGVLVLVSPWSGLPLAWLEWVLLVIGLSIIGIAVAMARGRNRSVTPLPPAPPANLPHEEANPRSSHIAFS